MPTAWTVWTVRTARRKGRTGRRALLWVGDGFDLEPAAFWRRQTSLSDLPDQGAALADTTAATARALAALRWTVVPVTLRGDEEGDLSDLGTSPLEVPPPPPPRRGGITLGRKTPQQRAEEALAREAGPPPVPLAPREPLERLAAESGGRVLEAAGQLPELLANLGGRLRVRFASRTVQGAAETVSTLAVEWSTPPGREAASRESLVAPHWIAHGTPPALAALRARRLLAGELDPGQTTVHAALAIHLSSEDEGSPAAAADERPAPVDAEPKYAAPAAQPVTLEVRVEAPPWAGEGDAPAFSAAPRRLTVAAQGEDGGPPVVVHRVVRGRLSAGDVVLQPGTPARRRPAPPTWVYRGEVELPPGAERVAVVVEEPDGRHWGGTVAGIFDAAPAAGGGWDVASGLLPGPRAVNLLRPRGAMLTGDVRMQAVADPAVAKVEFFVDGRRRDTVRQAPFATVLDFGRLPLARRVEAVGFAADGHELGRDTLLLNTGGGRLRVRIAEPRGPKAVGAVDVALDVQLPEGEALDRVDLYWRDQAVAKLFQPPFRYRLRIPQNDAEGFLRAVVHLADGSQAEDVVYLNGPLAGERIDVQLTELYVVVTDRDGRPVRGLGRDDFVVREEGEEQAVETFSDAGDLPITVGLAIDSSASMFVKLPEVEAAAASFLGELHAGRDRAFLVDFDDDVRLAAAPTRDLAAVRLAGSNLTADGHTSLWKAIVYSLVQIQGAPGRKALIVYSDGADEDDDFPFRNALDFARQVGVPIYVIVSNDEAVRTGGIPIGFPSLGRRLQRLTDEVGGRVWLVRRGDDLTEVYRRIREELSAQYLLGYYPRRGGWGGWRRVDVDVRRRGLEARTLAGYAR